MPLVPKHRESKAASLEVQFAFELQLQILTTLPQAPLSVCRQCSENAGLQSAEYLRLRGLERLAKSLDTSIPGCHIAQAKGADNL